MHQIAGVGTWHTLGYDGCRESYLGGLSFSLVSLLFAALLVAALQVASISEALAEGPQAQPQPAWVPAARLIAFPFQQLAR